MKIVNIIQQVKETKSLNAANKGTNNNANNSVAVAQSPRGRTDTVTLSKKSVALAAKTATKGAPKVEKAFDSQPDGGDFVHRLGVALETEEAISQSSGNGHGNGECSGNVNAVSLFSLSNNINSALESYKDVQKAEGEINHVL